jgi:hypothetical protein
MADSFGEFEASSLFCPRCKQADPVRQKLLLAAHKSAGRPTPTAASFTVWRPRLEDRCARAQIARPFRHRADRAGSTNQGDV